jgi:structural maintenance of chromosome 3 (chondroitin sulfate proteoglycan 6)
MAESSEELNESIAQIKARLEKTSIEQQKDETGVEKKQQSMEKFLARKAVLVQKKETALGHIRDLGVLPDEAFEKYSDVDGKQLLAKLHKVNEILKKYSHVNKKAFEQYGSFTKQREQLQDRKEELDTSAKVRFLKL